MRKLLFVLIALLFSSQAFAVVINNVEVDGVKRIDKEVIISELDIKKGTDVSDSKINEMIKKLYGLDLFENIQMNIVGNTLRVKVTENPTINLIEFNGNKDLDNDTLLSEINLKPRSVYSEYVVNDAINRMIELYKRSGFYRVEIKPDIQKKDQNRVNIVFNIKENKKTYIEEIDFEGNTYFSDNALKYVLMSKEDRWWRFFSSVTTYDPDRILYDQELLTQFYLNNGFVDFRIKEVVSNLTYDKSGYFMKIYITEGKRYRIGKLDIDNSIKEIKTKDLYRYLEVKEGEYYDASQVDLSIRKMQDKIADSGYAFIRIVPVPTQHKEKNTIDITFKVMPTKKMYINRSDIVGNVRTMDYVIEREFKTKEGDAFNLSELKRTEQKLMGTGYFKSAKVVTKGVDGDPDKLNLLTEIEEQSTGEVNFGFGWSSYNGGFVEAGIKEKNFMGRGQTLGLTGQYSNKQSRAVISFTEPYFMDYDLSAGADIDYSYFRYKDDYGYDMTRFGVGFRFAWNYFDNVRHFVRVSQRIDDITNIVGTPPQYAQKEEGASTIRLIDQTISIASIKTDYVNLTKRGYYMSFGLNYAGLNGDEHFIQPEFKAFFYRNFWENEWQLGLSFNAGYIQPIKDEYIKKSYRYNLGGETLRGFHVAGIGARDKIYRNYSLGAYSEMYGTVQLNFPLGLPKEYKISGFVFYDYGKLGKPADLDYNTMYYDDTWRTSVGFGIKWYTPMGEINVSWAKPLQYEPYDRLERFLLSFGAQF